MNNLANLQKKIRTTALNAGRQPENIEIIAVSKGRSIPQMLEVYQAGISTFGESYWQEAREKIKLLSDLPITWHFIGSIQRNKTAEIAHYFDWVHGLYQQKTAHLLAKHRPANAQPLNVCLQINLDHVPHQSGLFLEQKDAIHALADFIEATPQLKLRGCMTILKQELNETEQYARFEQLHQLLAQLNERFHGSFDTLSMGMSHDFIAAIKAGATQLRLGRAVFG